MRNFTQIQEILGTQPDVKKIYLIGCTGAGKTSLVQHIIGTKKHGFPVTTHRRTTIAPTEYVVQKSLPFKATIILKKKKDVTIAIEELIQSAILKAKQDNSKIDDVVYELEQSPDERFKLGQMVKNETFLSIAKYIVDNILPSIENKTLNDETIFSSIEIKSYIDNLVTTIMSEIESNFIMACGEGHEIFGDQPIYIEGINDKDDFISKCKHLLSNEFGSISILAEYVRIEGDLLAGWLKSENEFEFVLIDGEGIGHSLGEKRDTLSARHYDYFNYCNNIVLVDDASNPFAAGGHGAVVGVFLNGYQNKFRLAFSKVDKLDLTDQNAYFRRNLNNLKNALKDEGIEFSEENKDTYKLSSLDKEINQDSKKSILSLLRNINESQESNPTSLEYDFDVLFSNFNIDSLVDSIEKAINTEHWTVVKALSRRLLNFDIEYRHLKPLSWILMAIMHEVNSFLKRDELSSDVLDSQNKIKQNFSQELVKYIFINFIIEKEHLWQQAFEISGLGSHKLRKKFIFSQILSVFLPSKDNKERFNIFRNEIKVLLIKSGAIELKTAVKTEITHISIKKIFGFKNIEWSLSGNTDILIGKNGCGKSTILKLIFACINNDRDELESFGSPYIELSILKTFDNGEQKSSKIIHSKSSPSINVVMVNTFDIKLDRNNDDVVDLDSQLSLLISKFGEYQRSLTKIVMKNVGDKIKERDEIIKNLASVEQESLSVLQKLSIEIAGEVERVNRPLLVFKNIIDQYFLGTNKKLILDNEDLPLLIEANNEDSKCLIRASDLSSGEKQLLLIFLTVVLQRDANFILLMDEPETSLHVEWQSTFIDNIRTLNNNIQIILATHNPLILLNRERNEIGVLESNCEIVQKRSIGAKYLDVSSILLEYFKLPSLIGKQMQDDINKFTILKMRENELNNEEVHEFQRIKLLLESSLVGDVVYNKAYFNFLSFIKKNKGIELDSLNDVDDEDLAIFMSEFGSLHND